MVDVRKICDFPITIHLILGKFHSRDDSGMERLLGLLVHLVIKLIHSWNDRSDTG